MINTGRIIAKAMEKRGVTVEELAVEANVKDVIVENMLRMNRGMKRIDAYHQNVLSALGLSYSQVKIPYKKGGKKNPKHLYSGAEKVAKSKKPRENGKDRYFIFDTTTNSIVARFDRL